MSTGYTCVIEEGASFEEFVLRCARRFGALVHMRDDPLNEPIPDEVPRSNFYEQALAKAEKNLSRLKSMTVEEANQKALEDHKEVVKSCKQRVKEKRDLYEKYRDMLIKVEAWNPPTKDHVELKKFMVQQILDSIDFDCNETIVYNNCPKNPMTGQEWLDFWIKETEKDIKYYKKEREKDLERARKKTEWIQNLKKSLAL